jgi:hypothetical protein
MGGGIRQQLLDRLKEKEKILQFERTQDRSVWRTHF